MISGPFTGSAGKALGDAGPPERQPGGPRSGRARLRRTGPPGPSSLVRGGAQQRGERLEGGHELTGPGRVRAPAGPGREVAGDRPGPLPGGAARPAQPAVIPDQAAIADPAGHGGELRCREAADASGLLRRPARAEGGQDVRRTAAGTLGHHGRDVPVATVPAQQGAGMKQAGHHAAGDRDRAARRTRAGPRTGARAAALISSSAARAKAAVPARSPRIRRGGCTQPARRAAIAASGVVARHTAGLWRATTPAAKPQNSASATSAAASPTGPARPAKQVPR